MESWRCGDDLVCGRVGGRAPSGLRAWAAASGRQLTQQRCDPALRLLAEARELLLGHTLAVPFKPDRVQLPKNLPVCFLDFSHHCPLCHYVIVRASKIDLAERTYSSID